MFLSLLYNQKLVNSTVNVSISQPRSKSSNILAFFASLSYSRYRVGEVYSLALQIPVRTQTHINSMYTIDQKKDKHTSQEALIME